jgi:hypothetical protein
MMLAITVTIAGLKGLLPGFSRKNVMKNVSPEFSSKITFVEKTNPQNTSDISIIRSEPPSFPPGTHLPPIRELFVCGGIDLVNFSPSNELVRVDDDRVWWQSDNDPDTTEDDHLVHVSLEPHLRRLIELVHQCNGKLKVHDAYSLKNIHTPLSLHKEGRAIDVTADGLSLEKLAKLCWVAGFDWVYYEKGTGTRGAHIHCSVTRKKSFK